MDLWIIDDDETFRDVLADGLTSVGSYSVTGFGSSEAAIAALDDGARKPSVVLLDINLPGMSGIRAIPPLTKAAPDACIIMLTVNDTDLTVTNALSRGAHGYVTKSSGLDSISQAIETTLKGHRYLDPPATSALVKAFLANNQPTPDHELSDREIEILRLVADGYSRHEIAEKLGLASSTMITHMKAIFQKLQVKKSTEAVAKALKDRLL